MEKNLTFELNNFVYVKLLW